MGSGKLNQLRSATLMSLSILAIGFAVSVRADDTAASSATAGSAASAATTAPPDHAAVWAARKKCAESNGLVKGTRPTKAQHEAMHACMKAAGFDRPPGPPGGHHHDGPPPEDSDASSSGSAAESAN